jgi:malonate-semialdehyde dehydrogenase (acetylating)/methylmalonate-semialdehyde dehydrogenase
MTVGAGLGQAQEPHMGPLISRQHADKVLNYINVGVEEGAHLLVDGRDFVVAGNEQGYFVGPTLFDYVKKGMRIYQEEIFGPVLAIVRVDTFEQALSLVNEHEYGNGTSIFTASGEAAQVYSHQVQVGMVGVNVPIPVPMAFHSFGGWKRSIFGPLNMHGNDGVRFYTKMKTITARWPTGQGHAGENHFTMPTMK